MSRRRRPQGNPAPAADRSISPRPTEGAAEERLRPWLLGSAIALLVARPLLVSESSEGDGLPIVMLWIALGAFWLLGEIGKPRFAIRFGWIDLAVLLSAAIYSLAAVVGAMQGSPRPAINALWEWLALSLAFFLLRQFAITGAQRRAVVASLLAAATALAAYGCYQALYELPQTRAAYHADRERWLREVGMEHYLNDPPRLKAFEDRLNSPEPLATFALTNSLAGLIVPWLIVAAGLGLAEIKRRRLWSTAAACAAVLGACLVLTMSRSGYLAALVGLGLLGAAIGRRVIGPKLLAATGGVLAILVVAAVFLRGIDASIFSQAGRSLGYRFQYWRSTVAMIGDHPALGVGPGNFQFAYTQYKLPDAAEEVADPHNFILEIWATAGTPALLAFAAVLGLFLLRVFRGSRDIAESEHREEPTAGIVAVAGTALGFFLAVPLGSVAEVSPPFAATLVGGAVAVAIVFLLRPWILSGRFDPRLTAVAVLALLVNLLAAGGISFPGVAGSFWALLALGTSEAEGSTNTTARRPMAVALLGGALLLAAACYTTAYRPVLEARAAMRAAVRSPERAEAWLRQAAAADRWAVEPWENLATVGVARYLNGENSAGLQLLDEATQQSLARGPNAASLRAAAGDRWSMVYEKSHRAEHLARAVESFRLAVELYPNSATLHAKLALALRKQGDLDGFHEEAARASDLDAAAPHANQKIPAELRKELERNS